MNDHSCPVIKVHLEPHPDADTLSVVRIGGFQCVVKTDGWVEGQLGAYVPPDSLVDTTRPEFDFLKADGNLGEDSRKSNGGRYARVRVKRLRGVVSMGLLIPLTYGISPEPAENDLAEVCTGEVGADGFPVYELLSEGDDATPALGVLHYDPPIAANVAQGESLGAGYGPSCYTPAYDVEDWRKSSGGFVDYEEVVVTEKIHGANARYTFDGATFWVGSRKEWKREGSLWHRAIATTPAVEAYCRANPGQVLYGEVYGPVQSLRYGLTEPRLALFDIMLPDGTYMSYYPFRGICHFEGLPTVPLIGIGPYNPLTITDLAEGGSLVVGAGHYREGAVFKPTVERLDRKGNRVIRKVVSTMYYETKGKERPYVAAVEV